MNFLKQNKLFAGFMLILLVGGGYYFFSGSSGSVPLLSSSDSGPTADAQQLLDQLGNLKSIQLDGSVFSDPVYLSLTDFGVTLSPEAVGRRNPFLPISGAAPSNTQLAVPGSK